MQIYRLASSRYEWKQLPVMYRNNRTTSALYKQNCSYFQNTMASKYNSCVTNMSHRF